MGWAFVFNRGIWKGLWGGGIGTKLEQGRGRPGIGLLQMGGMAFGKSGGTVEKKREDQWGRTWPWSRTPVGQVASEARACFCFIPSEVLAMGGFSAGRDVEKIASTTRMACCVDIGRADRSVREDGSPH